MKNKNRKNYKRKKKKIIWKQIFASNKQFIIVITILIIVFIQLVKFNLPVTEINRQGLKLLNAYEYPSYKVSADNCMSPYDVGDGVITFGPGITYPSVASGIKDINNNLGTSYTTENSCIATDDLLKMQKVIISDYEQIVINVSHLYNLKLNQDQFNALVLLAYNSPNIFKNPGFIAVLSNEDSTMDQYITAADNYYRTLSGYDTQFGSGWYNRIVDSAQVYYEGEYLFQNS